MKTPGYRLLFFVAAFLFTALLVAQNNRATSVTLQEKAEIQNYDWVSDSLEKTALLLRLKQLENKKQPERTPSTIGITLSQEKGYPVIDPLKDTLFFMYTKMGASTAKERAENIRLKIKRLCEDDFLNVDSIKIQKSENTYDVVYRETIILSVSEKDAAIHQLAIPELAQMRKTAIQEAVIKVRNENSITKWASRFGVVILVIALSSLIFRLMNKGFMRLQAYIEIHRSKWLKDLSYKDYTFLTAEQEVQILFFLFKLVRWFTYLILLYVTLPILFSIFPFSRDWADALFQLVLGPIKTVIVGVWNYLPNMFSILVIYFVMKYFIRFVKYIFHEIEQGKLIINGFHDDWAMPTYNIVKFLLYAFMLVLIFPYLPGSESTVFKGVSVFIGILFSLGSSSAIANMVAGLVITYMRPFKIGDRIKIGDITGDVLEKNMLVTRVKTPKNEVVTIPNASVLSGNTTNFSSEAANKGLILHTTVTIGYDVPWKNMHEALIEAALRTEGLLKKPKPFVLQTSLEDFYVAYQINAYTKEASKQSHLYSMLHQHIQDVCNERGIEILSPHYRGLRDGNPTTLPAQYLPEDYNPSGFKVDLNQKKPTEQNNNTES